QEDFNARVDRFKTYLIGKHSFLTASSFVNDPTGTDHQACVPGTIIDEEVEITPDTKVVIFFDSSGSMNSTLSPLVTMRNTLLKDRLLPFYNNDEELYNQMVGVHSNSSERTLFMLDNTGNPFTEPILIMIFQDEANASYHSPTTHVPRTELYDYDLANLRARVGALPNNYYRGMVFQVTRNVNEGAVFREFIRHVHHGIGEYWGDKSLSDMPQFGFTYDVENGNSPQYYMDLIITKMRELGYNI